MSARAIASPSLSTTRPSTKPAAAPRVVASAGVLKVGLELFVREGPAAVRLGEELGPRSSSI